MQKSRLYCILQYPFSHICDGTINFYIEFTAKITEFVPDVFTINATLNKLIHHQPDYFRNRAS